jgi:hypothetical protein
MKVGYCRRWVNNKKLELSLPWTLVPSPRTTTSWTIGLRRGCTPVRRG